MSATEPESRHMRHTDHGSYLRSYNVQLSTEARNNFIVGVSLTQDPNDSQHLAGALETVRRFTGHKPLRIIADTGYTHRESVTKMAAVGVELIAPMKDEDARGASARKRLGIADKFRKSRFPREGDHLRCPAGQELPLQKQKKHHGNSVQIFEAGATVCPACIHKPRCCPHTTEGRRIELVRESEAVRQHTVRMETERARQ